MKSLPGKSIYAPMLMVWGCLSLPIFTFAQEEEEDDIYEISPFVVLDEEDSGYIATQTLAGTRLRSNLADIGASVQVLTSEFLDDIGATESTDLLLFTTSTEIAGLGGNYSGGDSRQDDRVLTGAVLNNPQGASRIRGLGSPDNTRDFFLTSIPWDSYNSGRVEINRGANAILFGLGSPSGVQNVGLNRAVFDDINRVEFRVQDGGDELSYRAQVDFNRILVEDKLAIRVAAVRNNRNYPQKPAYQDQERSYITATWRPLEKHRYSRQLRKRPHTGQQPRSGGSSAGHRQLHSRNPPLPLRAGCRWQLRRSAGNQFALTYDPWRYSMRWPNSLYRRPDVQIDNYTNPFQNKASGNPWAWSGKGIPNIRFRISGRYPPTTTRSGSITTPSTPGVQHKVWYDYERPAADRPPNPRQPRGGRNFYRIDNAGPMIPVITPVSSKGSTTWKLFDFSEYLPGRDSSVPEPGFRRPPGLAGTKLLSEQTGLRTGLYQRIFQSPEFQWFPRPHHGGSDRYQPYPSHRHLRSQ